MRGGGRVGKGREKMRIKESFFFQAEDGIRDLVRSRGLGDVYKETAKKAMFYVILIFSSTKSLY